MAAPGSIDRRLQDRELLKGRVTEKQLKSDALAGSDNADNAETPEDAALAKLRDDLTAEKTARDERIVHALSTPRQAPVPRHAAAPLDDEI